MRADNHILTKAAASIQIEDSLSLFRIEIQPVPAATQCLWREPRYWLVPSGSWVPNCQQQIMDLCCRLSDGSITQPSNQPKKQALTQQREERFCSCK